MTTQIIISQSKLQPSNAVTFDSIFTFGKTTLHDADSYRRMTMRLADAINWMMTYDALQPDLIPVDNWRPQDPRRYDEKRKECIKYLRERNLYILDGKFTPTKSSHTDITVIFNRARQQQGETLIQVAK